MKKMVDRLVNEAMWTFDDTKFGIFVSAVVGRVGNGTQKGSLEDRGAGSGTKRGEKIV